MGIYKETIRKYMIGHQMRQVVSNNCVLDLTQFYLDATAVGATQDKTLFEAELNALPTLAKNEAETILVPGIYKNGKVYGFNGATKGLVEFSFSRASSGTLIDKNGVMQVAPVDVPRINYKDNVCEGYLMERASVNLFTNGDFSETGSTVAISGSIARGAYGDISFASWLRFNSYGTASIGFGSYNKDTDYTLSCYVKTQDGLPPATGDFRFILGGLYHTGFNVEKVGYNFYRCWRTINTNAAGAGCGIGKSEGSENDRIFMVTAFQVEEASFPTSYIPTTNGSVVRSMDFLASTGSILPFASATIYSNLAYVIGDGSNSVLLSKGTYRLLAGLYTYSNVLASSYNNSYYIAAAIQPENGAFRKIASSYNPNGIGLSCNGSSLVKNETPQSSSSNELILISTGTPRFYTGQMKHLAIFSRQLTDQEHIDITV